MPITALYRPYGIRIHTDDVDPAIVIAALNQFSVPDNVQVDREVTGGDVFASITTVSAHDENYTFTTLAVDDMIDLIGTGAICLKSANTKTGFELFLTALDECQAGPSVAANNLLYKSLSSSASIENYGLLYAGTLSVPHSGNASYSCTMTPRSVGANAAILIDPGVTLPSIPDLLKRWGMGPVKIGTFTLEGKQSVEINFGVSITKEMVDGSIFPDFVAVENILAVITIQGINQEWALDAGIPRGGKTGLHIDTELFLRKKDPALFGGFALDATAEHIKITANGRAFITDLASGNATAASSTTLIMYVEKDGSNAPLIANTLQAIV